ncbi:MAG: YraN family protein [Bacteroidetes bacterium]|nr:YraN family protein [Bacteroidota bacterium]
MAKHNELGKKGEKLAQEMLSKKGFEIIDTNWRFGNDEIDIVAMDGGELVIVEVKTRSTNFFGNPEDAVDNNKEKFLIRATESYLEENNLDLETRFDIVAIVLNNNETIIDHIEDAFYPE